MSVTIALRTWIRMCQDRSSSQPEGKQGIGFHATSALIGREVVNSIDSAVEVVNAAEKEETMRG